MPTPPAVLATGQRVHGFVVQAVTPLPGLRAVSYQLEHERSGARVLHVHADDSENLFSISFPTPPTDDTGVPHILEHGVLSGSRRYPVRDPFFEMCKISMATFINAMTGCDCTYYPVASNVKQDLFNLAEVYFDAVFHPLLTRESFLREGHHLAPADPRKPTGDLTINGIVYNEMKGAFSNPESRLFRCAQRGIFPDTLYGRESGGDPDHIPELTYTEFRRFHQAHYHPANAYVFLYGDIPTVEYLAFLRPRLRGFRRRQTPFPQVFQPRWHAPRAVADAYPVGKDEPLTERTYALLLWLVGDARDPVDVTGLNLLSLVLLGNEAAPLKKAIIESKLGQDLIYSGFSAIGLETMFQVGLKGTEPDRTDAFTRLVLDALGRIASAPIARDRVDAAFQQAAYDYLEVQPMFPLHTMERVLNAWVYGVDPLTFLRMSEHLEVCRQRYDAQPLLFNTMIRERLLANPHRLGVVLSPDRDWQARADSDFAARMKAVRARTSLRRARRLAHQAEELDRLSGTPNPPEAVATLPQLRVSDLSRRPRHIPTTAERLPGGALLLTNDVFANGVSYLHLNLDLAGLPADLWPFVPRYCDAIRKLGAAGLGYEQIAARKAACTGGIGAGTYLGSDAVDPRRSVRGLNLTLKALDDRIEPALNVLGDLLFGVDPRDRGRLAEVLTQTRAWYRTNLVHQGSGTASRHAARGFTAEAYLSEVMNGLPQLPLLDHYTAAAEATAEEMMAKIEAVREFLLGQGRLTASFTGSEPARAVVRQTLAAWAARMRPEPIREAPVGFVPYQQPPREGLAGPVQVAFCAMVLPAPHHSHPDAPLITLGAHLADYDYMINEIRLKGNAYGAWCNYSDFGQTFSLGSYRDPHVTRTLSAFSGLRAYVERTSWTQADVDRAIIATAKFDEQPIRPGSATGQALYRHLTGQTIERREERYERLLDASAAEVRRACVDFLAANQAQAAVCVVSSREKLEEANREMPATPLTIQDILS